MGAQKIKLSAVQTLEAWPVKFKGSKDYIRLIHVIFFFFFGESLIFLTWG